MSEINFRDANDRGLRTPFNGLHQWFTSNGLARITFIHSEIVRSSDRKKCKKVDKELLFKRIRETHDVYNLKVMRYGEWKTSFNLTKLRL